MSSDTSLTRCTSNSLSFGSTATLAYDVHHLSSATASKSGPKPILIVFLNGLVLPKSSWTATLDHLKTDFSSSKRPIYALTYDRSGQGESRGQTDLERRPSLHDLYFSAAELNTLLNHVVVSTFESSNATPSFIFVSQSIGVPLARLYAERHPSSVCAHLFLDSNIANSDFISLFPDPDSPTFNQSSLPSDLTVDDLRSIRSRVLKTFHPSALNAEGLDRSHLPQQLPSADEPKLYNPAIPDSKAPWVTVVGHDPETFAEEGLKLQGTPKSVNFKYVQPVWEEYNQGLCRLTREERRCNRGEVVVAKGSGHFVQKDRADLVAEEITGLVERVEGEI